MKRKRWIQEDWHFADVNNNVLNPSAPLPPIDLKPRKGGAVMTRCLGTNKVGEQCRVMISAAALRKRGRALCGAHRDQDVQAAQQRRDDTVERAVAARREAVADRRRRLDPGPPEDA